MIIEITESELLSYAKNKKYSLTACFPKKDKEVYVWTDYTSGSIEFVMTGSPDIDINRTPSQTIGLSGQFALPPEANIGEIRPVLHALSGNYHAYCKECPDDVFKLHYGPISSGLWESGAFHILSYGERILNVAPDLGYKHRAIEKKICGMNVKDALLLIERLCGTFSVAYSNAFCSAVEENIPERAEAIRIIALELERIYNHIHAIQRLATAASQSVAASQFSALEEDVLRLNAKFFRHRYLFGLNIPGGVRKDINTKVLLGRIIDIKREFDKLVELLITSTIFIDRLHNTAILNVEDIIRLDTIGIPARASGVGKDVRSFNSIYTDTPFRVAVEEYGDALSRMMVRITEIRNSVEIIKFFAENLPQTELKTDVDASGFLYGRSEAPPGDILTALEVENGIIKWAGIRPPSTINYPAFAVAIEGNIFTDFSFGIESFGLSFADSDR